MISVRAAKPSDEELYLNTWKMAQVDSVWFREGRPCAPRFEEEFSDARASFQQSDTRCWIATDDGNTVGVLACRKSGELARLGSGDREPAVLSDYRQTSAGTKLLDVAFDWSIREELAGVFSLLKLPPEVDPRRQWHVRLHFQWGMKLTRLVVQLGARIQTSKSYANPHVKFKGVNEIGLDRLCDMVLLSFESTKSFEYDPLVHDPPEVRAFHSEILESSPEGFFVAHLGDEPAGFVFARAPMARNRLCGHMAAIGVVPKHRGKKIGVSLLQKAHNYIIEKGFDRSFVGTSESNLTSLALYRKMGYQPAYRIMKFVKTIRPVNISRDIAHHDFSDLRPLELRRPNSV